MTYSQPFADIAETCTETLPAAESCEFTAWHDEPFAKLKEPSPLCSSSRIAFFPVSHLASRIRDFGARGRKISVPIPANCLLLFSNLVERDGPNVIKRLRLLAKIDFDV
jgi:hypothetical protein